MNFEQLFDNFQYQDLQWFVPVVAGLVIVIGGLFIGIVRGMSAGVIVALLFGGLISMSPVLLAQLEQHESRVGMASAQVARGSAELSMLNSAVVTDLSRVLATLRTALAGLSPIVADESEDEGGVKDPLIAQRFNQSLADTEDRLDVAISSLERVNVLREALESDMETLETEMSRAPAAAR